MPVNGENFFQKTFPAEDAARCQSSLLKLQPHLIEPITLTGSIASRFHLGADQRQPKAKLNDIDLVVNDLSGLRNSVSDDFLIRHFHPGREPGKILIMLVDRENRLRLDVFTPLANLSERLTNLDIDGRLYRFVSAEDILTRLLGVIFPLVKGEPVEKKYFDHFKRLLTAVDKRRAAEIWCATRQANQALDFEEAVRLINQNTAADSTLLQPFYYDQDVNRKCPWCVGSKAFPLAPLTEIHKILGYV